MGARRPIGQLPGRQASRQAGKKLAATVLVRMWFSKTGNTEKRTVFPPEVNSYHRGGRGTNNVQSPAGKHARTNSLGPGGTFLALYPATHAPSLRESPAQGKTAASAGNQSNPQKTRTTGKHGNKGWTGLGGLPSPPPRRPLVHFIFFASRPFARRGENERPLSYLPSPGNLSKNRPRTDDRAPSRECRVRG